MIMITEPCMSARYCRLQTAERSQHVAPRGTLRSSRHAGVDAAATVADSDAAEVVAAGRCA